VLEEVKPMGSSFQIARTMSFGGTHRELSKAEYQNAIEMAQKQGSEETLKKIYLEQISAFVDTRLMESDEQARQYIENFLALDKSNAQVYASLGVVRFQERDYPGAIEAFQVSLGLEDDRATKEHSYSRSFVGIALLQTMFTIKDYDGMMSQIERYGASAIGFWFRENLDDTYFQRRVMYAARKTSKIDLLIKCYQQEINNGQLSEKDLQAIMNCDPAERARLKLRLRSTRLATSSMFRCYLGWLYQECLGQPKEAIELWKIAFFQRPEFLKLGKIYSSLFTDEIVPEMFARFSQLLYDKALQPDGGVDESMVTLLETLRQRQEDFRNLDTNCVELTNQRSLNLLLARLYWRCGRKEEAQKLLNEQFQRAVDILRDDIGWNDLYGYELLARVLFTNGQEEKAKLAASLTRFFYGGYNLEDNNAEDNEFGMGRPPPLTCAGWCTYSKGPRVGYETPLYACTTCANVVFCEGCHHSLRIQTGEDKIFVCNPNHDFLKSPAEGLECIKGDLITMNGKRQPFTAWLEEVQKEWKTGLYFQT
jgi:tetratricopeptide (TPR) repeat protein